MKPLSLITVIAWLLVYSASLQNCIAQIENLEEKQSRLETEVATKTGDEKLIAYRELLHGYFYVPDKIRAQHIQQMLDEYQPLNDSKGIGTALVARANLQSKQGNIKAAQKTCEEAAKYGLDCASSLPEVHFDLLTIQASIARAIGDHKSSIRISKEAIQFAEPWGDRLQLNRPYRTLGIASYALGTRFKDVAYGQKEFEYTKRVNDMQGEAGASLVAALRLMRDKHYTESDQWLCNAEDLLSKINAPRLQLLAKLRRSQLDHLTSRNSEGHSQAQNSEHLQELQELASQDLGAFTNSDHIRLWTSICSVYCQLKQFNAAELAAQKQIQFASELPPARLHAKLNLVACTMQRAGHATDGKGKLLELAIGQLNDLKGTNPNTPRGNLRLLEMLTAAYRQNGQYQEALTTLRAKNLLSNKLVSENNLFQTELMREAFAARKRDLELGAAKQKQLAAEAELELQRTETAAATQIRNLVGISVLLLAAGTIIGFWQHFSRLSRQQAQHTQELSTELAQRTNELSLESEKRRTLAVENERKRRHETVGKIAGGIAHDFNNLLAVIIQSNEMLNCNLDRKTAQETIQRSNKAADTATDIVRQLMAYVSKTPLTNSQVDINLWLKDVSGLFESALPSHIDFEIKNSTTGLSVYSDSAQLTTAVINIITNAKDAVSDHPAATITLEIDHQQSELRPQLVTADEPSQGCLVISVTDNGQGMTAEQLEFACEPFVTTKNMGIGTGLGLSMVSGFARQSGGRLQIESEQEVGTRVAIYFPITNPAPIDPSGLPIPKSISKLESVLLVEDDEALRASIFTTLKKSGSQIYVASNGDEAIEFLRTHPTPDLILSDIEMPGNHNGIALRQWILRNELQTMIILMSGFHQNELDDEVLFLPKPFRLSALENLIGRSELLLR